MKRYNRDQVCENPNSYVFLVSLSPSPSPPCCQWGAWTCVCWFKHHDGLCFSQKHEVVNTGYILYLNDWAFRCFCVVQQRMMMMTHDNIDHFSSCPLTPFGVVKVVLATNVHCRDKGDVIFSLSLFLFLFYFFTFSSCHLLLLLLVVLNVHVKPVLPSEQVPKCATCCR